MSRCPHLSTSEVFFFFLNGGGRVAGSVEGADGDIELQFASKLVLPLGLIT